MVTPRDSAATDEHAVVTGWATAFMGQAPASQGRSALLHYPLATGMGHRTATGKDPLKDHMGRSGATHSTPPCRERGGLKLVVLELGEWRWVQG